MKTTFSNALALCGLSLQQAADHFDVRLDTVKSWASGRNAVPVNIWIELASLWKRIEDTADNNTSEIEINLTKYLELGFIQTDDPENNLPAEASGRAGAMAVLITLSEMIKRF